MEIHGSDDISIDSPFNIGVNQFSPSVALNLLHSEEKARTLIQSDNEDKVMMKNNTHVMSQFPALAYRHTCTLHLPPE
jgi:hypothetical protein